MESLLGISSNKRCKNGLLPNTSQGRYKQGYAKPHINQCLHNDQNYLQATWLVSLHGGYGWTETHATPFRKLALFMVSVVVVVAVGVGGLLGAELRSSQRKPD